LPNVIPDARFARSGIQKIQSFATLLWIPGQAFGLPGMTPSKRTDNRIF